MKILYVTTVGGTMSFFELLIKKLIGEGHSIDIATNESVSKVPDCYRQFGCRILPISCTRSPLNKGSFLAIKELERIVAENSYDIVHCHTPIAAFCTRVACRKARKQGLRVFYTAHGFHFHKGAPMKNWMIFYPIEKLCARWTDALITINQEDYQRACKKLKAKKVYYVPGVGVDLCAFRNVTVDRETVRRELGIPMDATVLLSVGELNDNKNQQAVIRAMSRVESQNIHYLIAGVGPSREQLSRLAKDHGLSDRVHLLGYRTDVSQLCHVADVFCFMSYREGLGIAAIEAMASGLPIITSNVHGINDYSENGVTGYKCAPSDVEAIARAINDLDTHPEQRRMMGEYNEKLVERYDVNVINEQMKKIYNV